MFKEKVWCEVEKCWADIEERQRKNIGRTWDCILCSACDFIHPIAHVEYVLEDEIEEEIHPDDILAFGPDGKQVPAFDIDGDKDEFQEFFDSSKRQDKRKQKRVPSYDGIPVVDAQNTEPLDEDEHKIS